MTQASFDNYRANLMYHHAEYAHSIVSKVEAGNCNIDCLLYNHRIATAFIYKLMRCYSLYPGDTAVIVGTGTVTFSIASLNIICLRSDFTYMPETDDSITSTVLNFGTTVTTVTEMTILGIRYYQLTLSDYPTANGSVAYTVSGLRESENPNCLTRTEMQDIVSWLNNIYQTSYCVDFVQP